MLKDEFEKSMTGRFHCGPNVIQNWVSFAEECVQDEQYINFTPEPDEQAVHRWLDGIYASLYFAQKQLGSKAVNEMLKLSETFCLYPHEIMGVIEHMKEGGSLDDLDKKAIDGKLDYDVKPPTLDDVQQDLKEISRKKSRER